MGAVFAYFYGEIFHIFNTVTVLIVLVGIALIVMRKIQPKLLLWAATLVIAGGIGNLIDRFRLSYVIDFIDFTLIDFAIFNVADSFVTVGAFMLMGYLIRDMIKELQAERAAKAASASASTPPEEALTESTENTDE